MNAKFCGQCGNLLAEGAKFCAVCGWKVIGMERAEQPASPPRPIESPQQTPQLPSPDYNTAGPSQSYNRNYGRSRGDSMQNPGEPSQNQFKQFSRNMRNESYNSQSKRFGIGLGIAVAAVIIIAAGFFGIRALKGTSLNINMPSIGKSSSVEAGNLSGIWMSEFTPLEVKVNGKSDPAYAAVIGKTSQIQMVLELQTDGKGTARFQGSSYGYEVKSAAEVQYKNGKIEVIYKDPAQGASLKYTGTVEKDGDDFKIEGSYETTYETDYVQGKMEMEGKWTASMSKGKVSKGVDTSKAKKDVAIEQLAGVWKGKMVYAEVKNLDKIPDASEKDKEMFKKLLGMEVDCSIEFEGNEMVFTITDPTGGKSDLDELPPITLQDGVFTAAMKVDDKEGQGKMNIYGVVTEQKGQMAINGELSMTMNFKAGTEIEFLITYSVAK